MDDGLMHDGQNQAAAQGRAAALSVGVFNPGFDD